jgi:mannitol/fructose-specific phosphotransferase system IIA component (Ntr-type)
MSFLQSLCSDCVQTGSPARSKSEVLEEISRLAKRSALLAEFSGARILSSLQEREKIGSTAFGAGVAIPHCALEGLEDFVVGVLVVPDGVDFQALDGKRTSIFFFILGPPSARNRHIQLLSAISRVFKDPGAFSRVMEAREQRSLLQTIRELFGPIRILEAGRRKDRCLLHVFIQTEQYFDEILQVFSAVGNAAVLETRSAGEYLYRMPLFAAYWTEGHRGFNRIIVAVVDKDLCNEVVRRIDTIAEGVDQSTGLMVVAQDLFYTSGSLEL